MNTLYFNEAVLDQLLEDAFSAYLEGVSTADSGVLDMYKSIEKFGNISIYDDGCVFFVEYKSK